MSDTKSLDDSEMYETKDGEFIATKAEDADTFGRKRHILVPDTKEVWVDENGREVDSDDEDKDHKEELWSGTYSSHCGRKTAPNSIRGKSLEVADAYNLILNAVDVCPTCAKRAGLEAHFNYAELREKARSDPDDTDTDEDERITVRASQSVTFDFPESAKFDIIEVLRDQSLADDGDDGLSGLAGAVGDDDVIDVPSEEAE